MPVTLKTIETVGDLRVLLEDYPSNMKLRTLDVESGFKSEILSIEQDSTDLSQVVFVCQMEP